MPAGPIGSCWVAHSWPDTAWEAFSWAGSAAAGPTITTTSLPAGRQGVAYSQTVHATGGTTPYTWTIDSGSLPPGLNLAAATGIISGIPTTPGVYPFVIKVTDADTNDDTQPLSITILAPITPGAGGEGSAHIVLGRVWYPSDSTILGGF